MVDPQATCGTARGGSAPANRSLVGCGSLLLASCLTACASPSALFVDLRTDLAPGIEFDEVFVTLDSDASAALERAGERRLQRRRARRAVPTGPRRHSPPSCRAPGEWTARGVPRSRGALARQPRGGRHNHAPMRRRGVPARRRSGGRHELLRGPVRRPELWFEPDDPSLGACMPSDCMTSADCPTSGPCVSPVCDQGACLSLPQADRCGADQYCDPSDGTCRALPGNDAGTMDAATPDAGPPDAGPPDAGPPDAGPPDAGPPDAGPLEAPTGVTATPDSGGDRRDVDRRAGGDELHPRESRQPRTSPRRCRCPE